MGDDTVIVRRSTPGDGIAVRQVRLAALLDAPTAFGSTFAAEVDLSDGEWEARAARGSGGCEVGTWLAVRAGHQGPVGVVAAHHPGGEPGTVQLVSMWVAPAQRGRGVAERLVAEVVDWARACGDVAVELDVTATNRRAIRLYERLGFRSTDRRARLPSDRTLSTVVMRLAL